MKTYKCNVHGQVFSVKLVGGVVLIIWWYESLASSTETGYSNIRCQHQINLSQSSNA